MFVDFLQAGGGLDITIENAERSITVSWLQERVS